jgi:hypothetical protein
MAQEAKKYVTISGGPSKYDLMLGLFDRECNRPRPVYFKLQIPGRSHPQGMELHVESVGIEDGSGESWIVSGSDWKNNVKYKLYYSTQTRTGTVLEQK